MYTLHFNNYILHNLRDPARRVREPDVHLAVGEAGEMSFVIDPDHPHADKLTRMSGVVKLLADSVQIFKGRIRKDIQDFNLSRRIEVEGLLACLNDSIIPPFNFPEDFLENAAYQAAAASGNVVEFFLGWLLDQHNAQVGQEQKIMLGTVTVADPNNYITRSSSEFMTTMEAVRKKLEDLLGGYLLADYSGDTTVLHYYDDLPLTNIQEVEFAKNLLDLETELDGSDTYTAILPVGKDGLTIADLEDGQISPGYMKAGLIVYSTEAENIIGGRITRKVDWKDVTEATNLRNKATTLLSTEGVKHVQTISCKAVDLGGADGLPRFMVGRYVQLKSRPHGFAAAYPLMELDPDIMDPGNTEITLGATVKSASDLAHRNQSSAAEQLEHLKADLVNKFNHTAQEMTQKIEGIDGLYFWVKYSAHADGHDMTSVPVADTQYMGTYSARLKDAVAPTDYRLYTWVKITGKDGMPGKPGDNGKTQYLHIKYSDDGRLFTGCLLSADIEKWESGAVPTKGNIETPVSVSGFKNHVSYRDTIHVNPGDQFELNTGHYYVGFFVREYDELGLYYSTSPIWYDDSGVYTVPAGVYHLRFCMISSTSDLSDFDGFAAAFESRAIEPEVKKPGTVLGEALGAYIGTLVDFKEEDSEIFTDYTWKKFTEDVDDELEALRQTVTEQYTQILHDTESIMMRALKSYVETGDYETYKKTVESSMSLLKDEFSLKFTETTDSIKNVNGDLQQISERVYKHFDFTLEDGLVIKAGPNTLSLQLDNDLISFQKNGQQFGWWDGVDFHTGNIVIAVNERAQLGRFAFVPRSNGSLDFLKVGD